MSSLYRSMIMTSDARGDSRIIPAGLGLLPLPAVFDFGAGNNKLWPIGFPLIHQKVIASLRGFRSCERLTFPAKKLAGCSTPTAVQATAACASKACSRKQRKPRRTACAVCLLNAACTSLGFSAKGVVPASFANAAFLSATQVRGAFTPALRKLCACELIEPGAWNAVAGSAASNIASESTQVVSEIA